MIKHCFWLVLIIFLISLWLRVDTYQTRHPDQDELFELFSFNEKKLSSVFDNKAFYGDHTSFPGEYLVYYIPMKMVLKNPYSIDVGNMAVTGMKRNDFWKLAIPKIIMYVVSFWLLYLICQSWAGGWGSVLALMIYGFNFQLVYHAFEMRPYSVLPFLAILNLFLAARNNKSIWFDIAHGFVIFLTSIYHAYGLMTAFLPLFFMPQERKIRIWLVFPLALAGWAYYAWYNYFGLFPNGMQSQVDPFQYAPKTKFFENLLFNLSGGSLIFYALIPLLAWSLLKGLDIEDWKFLGLLILLPIALICLVDIKTHYWIHPRQYVWVIPFFAVFCGQQLNKI